MNNNRSSIIINVASPRRPFCASGNKSRPEECDSLIAFKNHPTRILWTMIFIAMNSDGAVLLLVCKYIHGMPEVVRQTWERGAPQIYNAVSQP